MLWILQNNAPEWSTMKGCVVRAETEDLARKVASSKAYGEGRNLWLDPEKTTCKVLESEGPRCSILESYVD